MNDDQFQGNLTVQGGDPGQFNEQPLGGGDYSVAPVDNFSMVDSSATSPDASADNYSVADDPFITQDPDNNGKFEINADADNPPDEAPQPVEEQHVIDPEMSRKMDEILGNSDIEPIQPFTEPVTPVEPVNPPEAISVSAPAAPIDVVIPAPAAPVEPVAPEATRIEVQAPTIVEPVNPVGQVGQVERVGQVGQVGRVEPLSQIEAPVAPVEMVQPTEIVQPEMPMQPMQPEIPAQPVAPMQPAQPAQPASSNIEQAAAQNMAAPKKKSKKTLIALIGIILVLAISGTVAAIVMSQPRKPEPQSDDGEVNEVEPDEPDTPTTTEQRIGTETGGYVDIPKDWVRFTKQEDAKVSGFAYSDKEGKTIVALNSSLASKDMTAKSFADSQLEYAKAEKASMPQLVPAKIAKYDGYQVFYYDTVANRWAYKYIFEAEDKRVHYLQLYIEDNTSELVTTIPASWSLSQTSTKTENKVEAAPQSTSGSAAKIAE